MTIARRIEMPFTYYHLETIAHELAHNQWLKQLLDAKVSCASLQTGPHIDSLPTQRGVGLPALL